MGTNAVAAFMLTLAAGAATGLGALAAVFAKRTNTRFLACSLGFSAGVMIYVSMAEMLIKGKDYLCGAHGEVMGNWYAVAAFFGGMVLIGLIDWFVPSAEGDIGNLKDEKSKALNRMGILTALAIAVHNFPEGLATFTSSLNDAGLGAAIAVAIAIHNIPEGIATAIPIYYSTGSRMRAFVISFLSGITEPVGAVIGYLLLKPFFNDTIFGVLFAMIAGIMVFISIEELLPMAREYDKGKATIMGFLGGMVIIAVSLIMFL